MPEITDQTGARLRLQKPAVRIVSLVPSITELLYHLQLDNEVKGITKFCIHPEHWRTTKTIIGGTKKVKHEVIISLQPDLILANKEENHREDAERLREKFQVYTSDIKNLEDALQMIEHTGLLTGKEKSGENCIHSIRNNFEMLTKMIKGMHGIRALYLIWKKPYMTVGGDTFIHCLMQQAGLTNVFGHLTRYPELTEKQISESKAEVVLLSSEPYPFQEKHKAAIQKLLPSAELLLVDGTYFSWYGSRLIHTPDYLLRLRERMSTMRTFGAPS